MAKWKTPAFFKRPARTKYAALTADTQYLTRTFPKDARVMLEKLIPVFDDVRAQPFGAPRWLALLRQMPDDILVDLPKLKLTKTNQAIHVTVMLTVFARVLHYPHEGNELLCMMSDEEVHTATNRIIIFYLPVEHFRRQGYLEADIPSDPFASWTNFTVRYSKAGLAAGPALDLFAPQDNIKVGQPVTVNFHEWGLE